MNDIDRAELALKELPAEAEQDAFVDGLRSQLTEMLYALARHRQRGADLVYEAYDVDLGGG
jgi:hypothetical protein